MGEGAFPELPFALFSLLLLFKSSPVFDPDGVPGW